MKLLKGPLFGGLAILEDDVFGRIILARQAIEADGDVSIRDGDGERVRIPFHRRGFDGIGNGDFAECVGRIRSEKLAGDLVAVAGEIGKVDDAGMMDPVGGGATAGGFEFAAVGIDDHDSVDGAGDVLLDGRIVAHEPESNTVILKAEG